MDLARNEARLHFKWMATFRSWVAFHGGVYAPISENTPPNEYLDVPERDITTPSGKGLTLINPAYMTCQVYEMYSRKMGIKGHITSLKPIRPANEPDDWERSALESFEKGDTERVELSEIGGERYLRLMRPLLVEQTCLKCHAAQGYKLGDIRGGISVSVPMTKYLEYERQETIDHVVAQGLVWVMGIVAVILGAMRISRQLVMNEKSEEEIKFLFTAMEHACDIIVITDVEGSIKYVNPMFEQVTGYSSDEVIGQNPRILKSGRQPDEYYKELWETITRGGVWKGRFINKCKDGRIVEEDTTISPVFNSKGRITEFVAIKRDVSREALLGRAKEFFTHAASHELRTPLTKLTLAQLLLRRVAESVPPSDQLNKSMEVIGEVSSGIRRIVTSTTMLIDFTSKLEMAMHPVKIYPILNLQLEYARIGSVAEGRQVDLSLDLSSLPEEISIPGNQEMIEKALDEVLSNAVKYTPDRRSVSVTGRIDGNFVIIEVRDNGTGVSIANPDRLFEPFFSMENVLEHNTGKYKFKSGGMGLGLTISRMIMDYHHGYIDLQSDGEGEGALVIIKLPLSSVEKF